MAHLMTPILFVITVLCSFSLFAADIPTVDEGATEYNQEMCVENYAENCINTICLTSEEIDCEDNCQQVAQDKCAQMSDD